MFLQKFIDKLENLFTVSLPDPTTSVSLLHEIVGIGICLRFLFCEDIEVCGRHKNY